MYRKELYPTGHMWLTYRPRQKEGNEKAVGVDGKIKENYHKLLSHLKPDRG